MIIDRRDRAYAAGALVGFLIGAAQLVRLAEWRMNLRKPSPATVDERPPSRFPAGTDRSIVKSAASAGTSRLESVEIRGTAREQLRLEWIGGSAAALALLSGSQSQGIGVRRVHVAASSLGARWTLTGEPAFPCSTESHPPALARDPLQSSAPAASSARLPVVKTRSRKSELIQKEREERARAEGAALAQAQRLEQRRRDIAAGASVSATMNNGHEPLAMVEVAEGGRRRTVTLRRGDSILGATVSAIDDQAGTVEVQLDEKNRMDLRVAGAR